MKKYLVIFAGIALIFGVLVVFNSVKGQEATTTQNQATTTQSQSPTIQPSTTTPTTSTPPTVPPVLSPNPSPTRPLIPNISEIKEELRQELSIKEIRGRVVCQAIGVCPKAGENTEVLIKSAKVEEIGADYLKISIFGYQYKVDLVNAKIVRYGWLESNINEFSVGDIVNVWGFLDEGDKYLIHAKNVRNVSIQKVHDVFRGVIESIDATSTSFVLAPEQGQCVELPMFPPKKFCPQGNHFNVVVDANTKIIKSQQVECVKAPCPPVQVSGSFADLQVGMKVVVRGLLDKTLSKIQARLIIIGEEEFPRPMPLLEKAGKSGNEIEKEESGNEIEKEERKIEGKAKGMNVKIEELQKKLLEILEKLKTATSTSQ